MAHATGSRRQLIYGKETGGFKVKPTTGIKVLRNTGDSINLTKNTLTSAELSGDRAIRFLRHGNETVSGDVSFEFAYADFDDLLASSLGSAWVADVLKQGVLAIGTYTFEKGFQDIEQYIAYKGCAVNTFSIDMASDALVTGSVGFVGAGTDGFATASTLSTPTPATANEPFTSYQVEGYIQIGAPTTNVLVDTCLVTACNFSVDNGITANYSLCSNEAASITPDRINVTGNITVLFADEKEVKKFIDEEETSLSVKLADPDGQNYTFFCPKIKYTGGDIAVSGGGVISISLPFQALYDDTVGVKTSIEITRAGSL